MLSRDAEAQRVLEIVKIENSIKGLNSALTMAMDRIGTRGLTEEETTMAILAREELVKVIVDKEILLRSISKELDKQLLLGYIIRIFRYRLN